MNNMITAILPLPEDPNFRVIYVNEIAEVTVPIATVEQLDLHEEQHWTEELSHQITLREDVESAMSMALKLVSMKAWGVQELADRLKKRGIGAETALLSSKQLETDGWLDDIAYARARIRDWIRVEPASHFWLCNKLRERKLSEETIALAIEQELKTLSEQDSATELAIIRLAKVTSQDEMTKRRRVISALGRRGFTSDVAAEAFRRAQSENT